jgi:predicted RNA-binding Zn-ribbon protein involved in translation (DUF1610 family)
MGIKWVKSLFSEIGWAWRTLFSDKPKDAPTVKTPQEQPINAEIKVERTIITQPCEICGLQIGQDKYNRSQGVYYHKRCIRQKVREQRRMMGV